MHPIQHRMTKNTKKQESKSSPVELLKDTPQETLEAKSQISVQLQEMKGIMGKREQHPVM